MDAHHSSAEPSVNPQSVEAFSDLDLFSSAFRYAAIGMALVSLDGRFIRVNRSFCEITGRSESELQATDFQSVTHPEDLSIDLDHVANLLAARIDSYRMEKRYRHTDGRWIWVLLSVSLVRSAAGAPRCFVSQVEDISERKRLAVDLLAREAELHDREVELRTVMEAVPDSILRYDREGRVLYVNQACCSLWGLQPKDFLGKTLQEAGLPERTWARSRENLRRVFETGSEAIYEQVTSFEGVHRYFQVRVLPERGWDGQFETVLVVTNEVTGLRQAQQDLQQANATLAALARVDPLTGAGNRRHFNERLEEESSEAVRNGRPCCLALVDLDHFKAVNDTIGHVGGDNVLRATARVLESSLRPIDFVARYGGEEFGLILPGTPLHGGLIAAERCRAAIENHGWPDMRITASIGVAEWTGPDIQAWLVQADLELYAAKSQGRNRVRPTMV